ncbi:MAG TPA: hypothetical protein VF791_23280 [Pyrinomonadaceae bacterium]
MTVCPCCGFKFEGDLQHDGCASCGARAVGSPLSKPFKELPFYGRALFIGALGGLMLAVFLASTVIALREREPVSFAFWSVVSAAETAAWRLKWLALPSAAFALWAGFLICASIRRNPKRFGGRRIAHWGLTSVVLTSVMIATLIGVTIPERLRHNRRSQEAAVYAQGYTIQRALLEYRLRYKTLPATLDDLKTLPDLDGSIAAALEGIDAGAYSPGADLAAALPGKKARTSRGSALGNASARPTVDAPQGGLSFTKYEMRLPGLDKMPGTEDDWTMRDDVIIKPAEAEESAASSNPSNKP